MADQPIPTPVDADPMEVALLDIIKTATSPEAFEAQTILLRRLALQGDVIPSRVPAPRNITEIGGYLNLLASGGQPEMRQQALAGILGVAGPNPPLGWTLSQPMLSFVALANDRPDGASQPTIPLGISIRSDFVTAFQAALKTLHDQGCTLPLMADYYPLPPAVNGTPIPNDPLPYLGRSIAIVPGTALRDPATDPIALARPLGSSTPYEILARVIAPGPVAVANADWEALKCDSTTCSPQTLSASQFVRVAPILATAGFYPGSPLTQPTNVNSADWARFTNITGLVAGVTTLGDELARLYTLSDVSGSSFAARTGWIWNGSSFAQP